MLCNNCSIVIMLSEFKQLLRNLLKLQRNLKDKAVKFLFDVDNWITIVYPKYHIFNLYLVVQIFATTIKSLIALTSPLSPSPTRLNSLIRVTVDYLLAVVHDPLLTSISDFLVPDDEYVFIINLIKLSLNEGPHLLSFSCYEFKCGWS